MSINALKHAVELNAVAIKANLQALHLGRQLAVVGLEKTNILHIQPSAPSYKELLVDRQQRLTAYQNQALAAQYTQQLKQWQKTLSVRLPVDQTLPLLRSLATSYFKLLAVKDEYEVARLFSQPSFRARLDAEFIGNFSVYLNLSPLGFAGWNKHLNQPKKYRVGSWILHAMKPLSMLKGIRSSVLDPYSYSSERKAERAFLSYFVSQVDALIDLLSTHNKADILLAINLFENVRGYGHVRAASMTKAKLQMESSLRELGIDEQTYAAHI